MPALPGRLPILAYHSISEEQRDPWTVTPNVFRDQMRLLQSEGYRTLSLEEAVAALTAGTGDRLDRSLGLTFDDGYEDFLTEAAPTLAQFDFKATVFVITSRVERASQANRASSTGRLSVRDLHTVRSLGHSVGSHSVSHRRLTSLSAQEQSAEIAQSKIYLEDALGEPIFSFAYPYGIHSRTTVETARSAGYGCACIVGGLWLNTAGTDRYALRRHEVLNNYSLDDVRLLARRPVRPALIRSFLSRKKYGLMQRSRALWQALRA